MHKTQFYAAICAIAATATAAPPPLGGPQSQPGALVDAVAAAAAAAPLFVQAFGAPWIGADWSVSSDGLRELGLEVVGYCTPGYLLPPTRSPAAVILPSLRVTLTAGACGAALDRPNATALAPVVTCTPFAVAYVYQPAAILPARMTPGAAVGPACSLSVALPVANGTAGFTQVILPPITLTCPSLDALSKGDCVIRGGAKGGRRKKGKKGAGVSGVVDAEGVVGEVGEFLRAVFGKE